MDVILPEVLIEKKITYKEIYEYIKSDYFRYFASGKRNKYLLVHILNIVFRKKNHCFTFSFWYRLAYRNNFFVKKILGKIKRKYGLQIPKDVKIGYGLYIGHGIGIVISPSAIIGSNCNLSQFTTIGSNHGQAAIIGDNVYIGPSVCIVENVKIGNNVTIGAGSVVTKDIPDNATVAGVPAKIISYKTPGRYIQNKWIVK